METRRENLKILAAISATCAFPFSADELFGQEGIQPVAKFLTEDELKLVARISDLIIPAGDGSVDFQPLKDLITNTVAQKSWLDNGGTGTGHNRDAHDV